MYYLFLPGSLLNGVEIFVVVNVDLVEGKVGVTAGDQGNSGDQGEPGEGEVEVEGAGAGGERRSKRRGRMPEYGVSTILFRLRATH